MAKAPITFAITEAQYADLQRVLNPKQVKTAIYNAVSRTTSRAVTIATKAVAARLPIPRKYIVGENRHAAIKKRITKGERPEGRITISDRQLPLSAFKYRSNKAGVTVTIDKGQPSETFKHAFVANVKSKRQEEQGVSHKGIFVRRKINAASAQKYFKSGRTSHYKTAKSGSFNAKGYAWRLPMGELFGPTVLDFITRTEIQTAVLRDIGHEFDKQLDSQVSRFTKGKFSTLDDAVAAVLSLDSSTDASDA
jgi:hypothetical protein